MGKPKKSRKMRDCQREILKRSVRAYPSPPLLELVNAYSKVNEISKSAAINEMIKHFFNSMPKETKQNILRNSKNSY